MVSYMIWYVMYGVTHDLIYDIWYVMVSYMIMI